MKIIKTWEVLLAYFFAIAFAVCLVLGVFNWPYFIIAAAMLAAYFIWDYAKLRCPRCGSFINLDKLLYARKHDFHCQTCGQEMIVK